MTRTVRLALQLTLTGSLSLPFASTALGQAKASTDGAASGEPAAAAAVMTPPKLVGFVEATYPAEAKAAGHQAAVDLTLVLDAAGKVTDARVTTPVGEGFDEAAVAAARQFTFEPARRGSTAIAARIGYRYVFEQKVAAAPTTGAIEGRVLLQAKGDGELVRGADVTLTSEDGSIARQASTSAEGTFAFRDLPKGRYRVQIAGQDLATTIGEEEVTAGDLTEVTYRLEAPASKPSGDVLEFGATARIEAPPREVTKRTLKADELLRVAGTRGDALKAVEYMPGVARGTQGFVMIRGSGPNDSQVQFEGAPVYRLYHFGDLTSFVQSRLLERIDLYPGNFSARYGRKMGGIIDVGVRDPRKDGFHGMVDVNLIDTSILAEGPLGKRASIAIAAKRSYMDAWVGKVMPEEIGVTAAPVYWDYQLIATFAPTERDKFRALLFGSYDDFQLMLKKTDDKDPAIHGNLGQRSDFHRAQVEWKHKYSDTVEHDISASVGTFSYKVNVGPDLGYDVPGRNVFSRAEWRAGLTDGVKLMGGFDLQAVSFDGKYNGPALEPLDGNPDLDGPLATKSIVSFDRKIGYTSPAAYLEMSMQATDRLLLVPGGRVDYHGNVKRWSVDPRLTARYDLAEKTTLKGGVGLFSQEVDLVDALPVLGNPKLKLPRSEHYGVGVDQKIGDHVLLTVDGFHKRLERLTVASPVAGENLNSDGIGRIWGGELSARLDPSRRTNAFLSYTLSRSQRQDHPGEAWRLLSWDQTHILTAAGSLRLGAGWDLSGTFRYVSGNPSTPVTSSIYNANNDLYRPVYGGVNSARNPAFHRLDLRIEKTWQVKTGSVAAYLDVQNAYNHKNQEGQTYNYNYSQSKAIPGFPPIVFPTIGMRGEL